MKHIKIDPVTRLEGHGKIDIFLNIKVHFQVPELRGFEKFAQGRPVENYPITTRICGVCLKPPRNGLVAMTYIKYRFTCRQKT
jgi:F420-non-reducing hydrogenase large subunit